MKLPHKTRICVQPEGEKWDAEELFGGSKTSLEHCRIPKSATVYLTEENEGELKRDDFTLLNAVGETEETNALLCGRLAM